MKSNTFLAFIYLILGSHGFECPKDDCKITGCLYQDHSNCANFWQCDNTGKPYLKKCPDGLEFNEIYRYCDWPPSPTCGDDKPSTSQSTSTTQITSSTELTSTTLKPTTDQDCKCDQEKCEFDIALLDLVLFSVEVASIKYGENNLCKIAQYVRDYVNKYYKTNDWVVLVGSNALFQTPFDYASKLNYQPGTFIRYLHKHKTSIELFRPKVGEFPPEDLIRDKINCASTMTIHINETDMPNKRWIRVSSIVNSAFDRNNGNYQKTSEDIFNGIGKYCTGEWAVLVARNGMLTKKENFCAAYERYLGTYYLGTYERGDSGTGTHEVLVFAPGNPYINQPTPSPTRPPTSLPPRPTQTQRPTTDSGIQTTMLPDHFQCPAGDDCVVSMCLYQNHRNCSQFWQCYSDGSTYLHECPYGYEFNDEFKACDWPPSPTCNNI